SLPRYDPPPTLHSLPTRRSSDLPAGDAATVYAWVTGLAITPGTANATTYDQQRCQVAHPSADGHSYVIGSRYTEAEMKKVGPGRSEEHTSELQSRGHLVCRLLLE